jgi:uncharacterized protein YjdB
MPSILLETGFMTNEGDFNKLIKTANHKKIADGVADSVEASLKAAYTGSTAGGTESSGSTSSGYDDDDDDTISYAGSDVDVDDIYFEEDTVTINVGETLRLSPIIEPEDAEDAELTWRSSSSSVVTVDSGGRSKGIKAGTATISATASENGGEKATVEVEVTGSGVAAGTEISLKDAEYPYPEESYLTVYRNMPVSLVVVSETGERIKNSEFKWETSKSSIASVNQSGVVSGRAKGTCIITAEAGDVELEWDIEVSADKLEVKKISVKKSTYYVHEGGKQQLKWEIDPKAASAMQVRWVSTKSGIASVDEYGLITGKKEGDCTIIGTCGGARVTVNVVVSEDVIGPDEIELDTSSLEMRVGDREPLTAEVSPDDITDSSVTWKSSNEKVATVDNKGNVKAIKAGTATITCTATANKKATATCRITVY